jgi:SAM-dependent methyltransferase
MKICLACDNRFVATEWSCPKCRHCPPQEGGIALFAPSLVAGNSGFKPEYFRELATVEAGHFWFRNRNRLLIWAMHAYFPKAGRFLEIGCGTGFVLNGIRNEFPGMQLAGSELFLEALAFARARLPSVPLYQMDATRIPFAGEFDVVGAFDVLEHIDEDEKVLRQMDQAAKPGGGVLITVPQHPSLWSVADGRACHKRRYTRRELLGKVESAGFRVRRVTSFLTLLLPIMWLSRRRQDRHGRNAPNAEYQLRPITNRLLEAALRFESWLIRLGVGLPAGGSLLPVAQKP